MQYRVVATVTQNLGLSQMNNISYKKPTLTEIYSEVFLKANTLPAKAWFDLVPLLKTTFPQVEVVYGGQISVTEGTQHIQTMIPKVRCWDEGRQELAQLSADQFIVNRVGNYLGWENFKAQFASVKKIVEENTSDFSPISISISTTDKITVPVESFSLGKYIRCDGEIVPKYYAGISTATDITNGRGIIGTDGVNRQFKLVVRSVGKSMVIQIQATFHNRLDGESIDNTLEKLHDESNKFFESIITVTYRNDIMGGLA